MNKIIKFLRLTWCEQLLLLEAFILSGIMRLVVLLFPFRKIAAFMGNYMAESPLKIDTKARTTTQKVGWAVVLASLHTPWQSKCLVQALTAQAMLKCRRISCTMYLGVAKAKENNLIAHAWIRSGEDFITGAYERKWFTIVAQFASGIGGIKQ